MSEIKRWNVPDGSDYECSDGDFLLYTDHQTAIAAIEQRLKRAVELLQWNVQNFNRNLAGMPVKDADESISAAHLFLAEEASRG